MLSAAVTKDLGGDRGPAFYGAALRYAQSLWREGKPAQAILQLNKAWSADLPGAVPLADAGVSPYRALVWILQQGPDGGFLGNPVRHFQHLATRMSGPRAVARSWRAWAGFHLAERLLDGRDCPRDQRQIDAENLVIPAWPQVVGALTECGWPGEAADLCRVAGEFGMAE